MARPTKSGAPQARTTAPGDTLSAQCAALLSEIATGLRDVYAIGLATELALRQQDAERDVELADCLRAGVCGPAWDLAQRTNAVIASARNLSRARS